MIKKGQRKLLKGWEFKPIKEYINGAISVFNKENYSGNHFRYIEISSIDNIRKQITGLTVFKTEEAPSRAKYILREGDLIVSTVRPNLNAISLIDGEYDGCICSSGFSVLRLNKHAYAPYFFRYLASPRFVNAVTKMVQGAMYPAINDDDIKDFLIPIPPKYEDQITIANELESKMADVEKMRQAALRQKEAVEVFREALLRRHFPYKEGDPLPKGWQWYELDDILKLKNGINFSSSEVGKGTLTLDVYNMYTETLQPQLNNLYRVNKNISGEYLLKEGDILFVRSSVKREGVGWPTVFKGYEEPVSFCGFIIRGRLVRDDIDPKYLVLYSRMASVREKFISASGQTTITNISQDNLKRVKIPVANKMSEQKEIVQKIETRLLGLETLQHASERQSEAIQALPAAILREEFDFQEAKA